MSNLSSMSVTLTEGEQMLVRFVAEQRQNHHRRVGMVNLKTCDDGALHVETIGVGGELAFCKMRNLCPDFSLTAGVADCVSSTGKTIDVKTTEAKKGLRLNVHGNKRHSPCDWYVLLECHWPVFRLVGYASAEQVFDPKYERKNDYGNGGTYFSLEASDLLMGRPTEQLEQSV